MSEAKQKRFTTQVDLVSQGVFVLPASSLNPFTMNIAKTKYFKNLVFQLCPEEDTPLRDLPKFFQKHTSYRAFIDLPSGYTLSIIWWLHPEHQEHLVYDNNGDIQLQDKFAARKDNKYEVGFFSTSNQESLICFEEHDQVCQILNEERLEELLCKVAAAPMYANL